jgi:excisionase family DNA binding protein
MTVQGAAEYLNCNYVTIYRMLRAGELPGFRVGSRWNFNALTWTAGLKSAP